MFPGELFTKSGEPLAAYKICHASKKLHKLSNKNTSFAKRGADLNKCGI